jgi:[ribosomal protein S5]-alanine N-acetyltransferase
MSIHLRALLISDLEAILEWALDQEFCLANGWDFPINPEKLRAHWTRIITEPRDDFQRFGIDDMGSLLGYTDLAMIDWDEQRASFGIALARAYWGKGIAATAGALMLERAFVTLNLSRIVAEVHASNERSLRLMARLGFVREGTLRQHETYRGRKQDVILFGLLRADYQARGGSEHG